MNLQKNVDLKKYTTFKLGGAAEFFVEARSAEDVKEAMIWAKANKKQILVLSGGSNILVHDSGFSGLIIKVNINHLEFDSYKVRVGPGVILSYLMNKSLDEGLVGMEFAAGIPGMVGGAVRGNAGTYGIGVWDFITRLIYIDSSHKIKELKPDDSHFSYRHSIFKEKPWIILDVFLQLKKGDVDKARALIAKRLAKRMQTQPKNESSAGCMFKNVEISEADIHKLADKGLDISKCQNFKQLPAGWLIDQAGLKGYKIGGAQISDIHGNYVVNVGNATAEDVIMLISYIKQQIRDKYGVQLHEEVQIVG